MALLNLAAVSTAWYWGAALILVVVVLVLWLTVGRRADALDSAVSTTPLVAACDALTAASPIVVTARGVASPRIAQPLPAAAPPQAAPRADLAPPRVDVSPAIPPAARVASARPPRAKQGGTGRNNYYYQELTKKVAERVFGVPFQRNVRPDWMRNPVAARDGKHHPLELDLYAPAIEIAVEYNGEQHYLFPNKFMPHTKKGYAEFLAQRERDLAKLDLCDAHGTYLIQVPYNIVQDHDSPEAVIEAWLRYYHPDAVRAREAAAAAKAAPPAPPARAAEPPPEPAVVTRHGPLDPQGDRARGDGDPQGARAIAPPPDSPITPAGAWDDPGDRPQSVDAPASRAADADAPAPRAPARAVPAADLLALAPAPRAPPARAVTSRFRQR